MLRRLLKNLEEDGHLRELVQGSLTFFVLRVVGIPVSYLFTFLVARLFGAAPVGMFAIALTVLQIGTILAALGIGNALLRFIAECCARNEKATAKAIYLKGVFLCTPAAVVMTAAVYTGAPFVAEEVFRKSYLTPYIKVAAIGLLPGVLFSVNLETLRALKRIKEYALLHSVVLPLLSVIFFLAGYYIVNYSDAMLIIVSWVAGTTAAFILSSLSLWREFAGTARVKASISAGKMLSVALPMLMTGALFMVMGWTDTIMLGMWRTDAEVGVYNVAVRLAMVTSFSLMAVNSIAAPKFAEFWGRHDMEGLKRIAQQSTRLIFWTSTPVLILYLLFPSFFMGIFGEEFGQGGLALVILSIGQFVNAASGSVGYILQMTGKQNVLNNVVLCASFVNIVLNYILIPELGIYGAAVASCVAMVIFNLLPLFIIKKEYGFFTFDLRQFF